MLLYINYIKGLLEIRDKQLQVQKDLFKYLNETG